LQAVAYLYSKPALRTDAVHFAIALSYYGLLRVPSRADDTDLCMCPPPHLIRLSGAVTTAEIADSEICSLNFARLIKAYISPFAKLEPQTALQYAYLIALGSDVSERQKGLSLDLVRDIVLASRSWSKLLGSVRADGSKEVGTPFFAENKLTLTDRSDRARSPPPQAV